MRGKDGPRPPLRVPTGITPAHAGKRIIKKKCKRLRRDHPRACGEKRPTSSDLQRSLGSPPRMRGKANLAKLVGASTGITPAHAGKRSYGNSFASVFRDHPRACGEKQRTPKRCANILGSPPRMRGKVNGCKVLGRKKGITPAHAGKSRDGAVRPWEQRDHPRACGEKSITVFSCAMLTGSPPRMRGKGRLLRPAGRERGITPAHAGKSFR